MGSTLSSLFSALHQQEVLPQDEKNIYILALDGSGRTTICNYLSNNLYNKNNEQIISTYENPVSGFERACSRYLISFPHPTVSAVQRNVTWVSYHGQHKYNCRRGPWHLRFLSNPN